MNVDEYSVLVGSAKRMLKGLPTGSVDTIVTSPPYFGLRDYRSKGQIGLESSLALYLRHLVEVFREARRVLRPDGTLWLNVGDTMVAGRNGGVGATSLRGSRRNNTAAREAWEATGGGTHRRAPGMKPKDLMGVPWRLAFALQRDGWWLRMDIIWSKPNPVPESVRDRPTRSHEYLFLLSRSRRYRYDWRAIAEPASVNSHPRGKGVNPKAALETSQMGRANASFSQAVQGLVEMRNRRSVWVVYPEPQKGPHTATFPRELVRPCVLAGSRPHGLVMDPFAGTCTTGVVAIEEGRRPLMIELNPEYAEFGRRRMLAAIEAKGLATQQHFDGRPLQLGMFADQLRAMQEHRT